MSVSGRQRFSRESRLLVATIAVSVAVLVVLSRFRFPATAGTAGEGAPVQPLARLAARAAFDDLSLALGELSGRVSNTLLVVRVTGAQPTLRAALRVREDLALVALENGRVDGIIGIPGAVTTVAHDRVRGLALIRVPRAPFSLPLREAQPVTAPGYVAQVDVTTAGPSLRPIYVGRSDAVTDPRWDTPLFTIGRNAPDDAGAPVFTLDGRLVGLSTNTDGELTVIPAPVLLAAAAQLAAGDVAANGDLGVVTQSLDPALVAVTGVPHGAAVAAVRDEGPAAGVLVPGDVITAVDGQPVRTARAFDLRIARTAPGRRVTLTVRRGGGFVTVPATVGTRPRTTASAAAPVNGTLALGLTLRPIAGRGSEIVRVQAGSAAEAADLRTGDVITGAGTRQAPSPSDVVTAFAGAEGGLVVAIERDGQPRLVALRP